MNRAGEAKGLLASEVFESALGFVEANAISLCRTAKSAEEAFTGTLRSQAAQSLRTILHAFIANGEAAAREVAKHAQAAREGIEADTAHTNYLSAAHRARSTVDHSTAPRSESE
jgi:hypothetical protein